MAHAYLPALDDYGDSALPLDRLMHRNRHTRCIRYASETGEWPRASHRGMLCRDRAGRWRGEHTYILDVRRGKACLYCGRIRPGGDRYGQAVA